MKLIFLSLTALLILVNLAGLGALAARWFGHTGLTRLAGAALLVLALFFLEHFVGFGKLSWVWPLTTIGAIVLLVRRREQLFAHRDSEIAFAAGFMYALLWRLAFPDVRFGAESLTDLAFIANYFPGTRLPPTDHWLPPFPFDYYYALQHYAAALLGRIVGLDPGTAYNFAVCVVFGFVAELGWSVAKTLGVRLLPGALVVAALLVGGNGIAPIERFLFNDEGAQPAQRAETSLWRNTRFIGSYDGNVNSSLGKFLFAPPPPVSNPDLGPQELPLETIGYLTMLGDYHPPLGGFVLLLFALGLIALLEAEPTRSRLAALLGVSVPLSLAVNAWVFPLHALLVGAWALYRRWRGEPAHLGMLALGLSLGFVLLYPFLAGLGTAGRALPVHWVPASAHTPLPQFFALHWPFLVLSALALIDPGRRRLGAYLVVVFGVFMLLSEFVYFGDNGGRYLRFNTTLKWWSWIHIAVVGGIAAVALASALRAVRYAAVAVLLLLTAFQGFELARYYLYSPKPHFARMGGEGAVTEVPGYHDVLGFLRYAPKGVVLERPGENQGAYMVTSALSLFSGHAAFLGWPDHLRTWGRPDAEVTRRVVDIEAFYSGRMTDALGWLAHNDIRYIVWSESDNTRNPAAFGLVQQQIGSRYTWHEFRSGDPWRTGVWARR